MCVENHVLWGYRVSARLLVGLCWQKNWGAEVVLTTEITVRVPGLPIRDCTRGYNNRGHTRSPMSAIDVTQETFFERLYLVPGMGTSGPWVNCPNAPTTPTVQSTTISWIPCNFSPRMAPQFFCYHDSPSNLARLLGSWYPPHSPLSATQLRKKSRNTCKLSGVGIGAKGMELKLAIDHHPETNTKRSQTAIAIIMYSLSLNC